MTDTVRITHGTAASLVTALDGKAYHLDGVKAGNYLSVARDPALFAQDQFSVSMAFKSDALGKGGGLFRVHTAMQIDVTDDGQVVFNLLANSGGQHGIIKSAGLHLADGGWHAITMSYDAKAGAMVGYADGVEVGRIAVSGPTQVVQSWDPVIGDAFGKGFVGLVDDVAIRATSVSASEVAQQYAAFSDKVAASYDLFRVNFDGGKLADASPHAVALTHGTTASIANGAYALNGTAGTNSNYIGVADTAALAGQKQVTVSLDFKTAVGGTGLLKVPGSMQVDVTADGKVVFTLLGNDKGEHGTITSEKLGATDGAWHRVTLAYDAISGKMTGYVDGHAVGNLTVTGATKAFQSATTIGSPDAGAFKGSVDNVQFSGGSYSAAMQTEAKTAPSLQSMIADDAALFHASFDGTTLADQSLHGTKILHGSAASFVDGGYLLNGALDKNGGNYIGLAKDPAFFAKEQMTVSFDFKSSTTGVGGSLFRIHTALQIDVTNDGRAVFNLMANSKGEAGIVKSAALGLTDGTWHRVTLTYDSIAGKMTGYVDGVSVGQIAVTGATKGAELWGPMIGSPWANAFQGYVDNFDIRNGVVPPVSDNSAPHAGTDNLIATEDATTTFKATTLLANDTDADGNRLFITDAHVVSGTASAHVVNGNVVFTPGHHVSGPAWIEYLLDDHHGGHSVGTINVNVGATNDAPTAASAHFSVLSTVATGATVGTVTAHDAEGDQIAYSITNGNSANVFSIDGQGHVIVNKTSALVPGQPHQLTITATDGHGGSTPFTVDIAVKSIDQLMNAAKAIYAKPILINDAAGLANALKAATGGETFLLRPDVDYGVLVKTALLAKSTVTVTSLDPDHPSTITSLDLRSANNITFDHLRFEFHGTPVQYQNDVVVSNSNHITFTNSVFRGQATGYADTSHAQNGVSVTDASDVKFTNNEVSNYFHAFSGMRVKDFLVSNNDFHSIQGDGMHFAQVQGVTIAANQFHDFFGSDQLTQTHNDYIQFWTTATTAPSTDVMIRDNVFLSGDFQSQAIFFRDQLGDAGLGEMRFKSVTVQGNVIYNDNYHGITVPNADGVTIRENTIVGHPSGSATSSINVANSTGVSVYDNVAPAYSIAANNTIIRVDTNVTIQDQYANQPNYAGNVLLNPNEGVGASLSDLFVNPDGALVKADGTVAGSELLRIPTHPHDLTAIFTAAPSQAETGVQFTFDAKYTANASGLVGNAGKYVWDFGDGDKAEGIKANHTYYAPGDYHVVLTVLQTDGHSDTAEFHAAVKPQVDEVAGFDDSTLTFVHQDTSHTWGG